MSSIWLLGYQFVSEGWLRRIVGCKILVIVFVVGFRDFIVGWVLRIVGWFRLIVGPLRCVGFDWR